jgi:hypothetical protein
MKREQISCLCALREHEQCRGEGCWHLAEGQRCGCFCHAPVRHRSSGERATWSYWLERTRPIASDELGALPIKEGA